MRLPIRKTRIGTCLVTLCLTVATPLMTHAATEAPAPPPNIVYLATSLDFAYWKSMGWFNSRAMVGECERARSCGVEIARPAHA